MKRKLLKGLGLTSLVLGAIVLVVLHSVSAQAPAQGTITLNNLSSLSSVASVQVTVSGLDGYKNNITSAPITVTVNPPGNTGSGSNPTGTIAASPNPCTVAQGQTTCTINFTWQTTNAPSPQVVVDYYDSNGKIVPSQSNQLFSPLPSCSGTNCPAPWITPVGSYVFKLENCVSGTCTILSAITVTGNSPASCGADNQSCCTTGQACMGPNSTCQSNVCLPPPPVCGGNGQACCSPNNTCSGSLICSTKTCQNPPVPTLTIAPSTANTTVGTPVQFTATYDPDGAGPLPGQNVTAMAGWSSNNLGVATMDNTTPGKVNAVGSGATTISASYSGLTATAVLNVANVSGPDFTLSVAPSSQTIGQGMQGNYTVTVTPLNGFTGTVNLSDIMPSGVTANFTPQSINVTQGQNSTMTVAVSNSAAPGASTFTVKGTSVSPSLSHTQTATVDVTAAPQQNFTISIAPPSQNLVQGTTAKYQIIANPQNGFVANIALTVSGLPSGVTGSFDKPTVSPNSISWLTLTAAGNANIGAKAFTVTGKSQVPNLTNTQTATVNVTPAAPPSFTLTVNPTSQNIQQGTTGTYQVSVNPQNQFTGNVGLTVSGLPSGVTGSFDKPSISPGQQATLTLSASPSAAIGFQPFTVAGTSGVLSNSQLPSVNITAAPAQPGFTLSINPSTQTIPPGSSASYNVTMSPNNNFVGTVDLSMVPGGLPSGVTPSFNPTTISNSFPQSILTLSANANAAAGSASFIVKGIDSVNNAITGSAIANVTIPPGSQPGFTLAVQPSMQNLPEGGSVPYTLTLTRLNGYSGSVTLAESGLTGGVTPSFNPTTLSGTATNSTLTLSASVSATLGSQTFTVTGSDPVSGLLSSQSASVNVTNSGGSCGGLGQSCCNPGLTCSGVLVCTPGGTCTNPISISISPNPAWPGQPITAVASGGILTGNYTWTYDSGLVNLQLSGQNNNTLTGYYNATGSYKITAHDSAGNIASATLLVQGPSCTFTANPTQVVPPASSILTWSCVNAATCNINGKSVGAAGGSETVYPNLAMNNYTLTCDGNGSGPANQYQGTVTITASGPGVIKEGPPGSH